MDFRIVLVTTILALSCFASAYVNIPGYLKRGKMNKYAACRALFAQDAESFAVVSENEYGNKKQCNCSFHVNPPQSGLRISCEYVKEAVIPIPREIYQYLNQIIYFLVQYRIRETSDPWSEQRIEFTGDPQSRIDLKLGNGAPNVYEVQIYAVSSDNTRHLILSDEISAITGKSVLPQSNINRYPTSTETEHTQYTQSFSMTFDLITDTTMKILFTTESPDVFKVEYINNEQLSDVQLNLDGEATLTGLTPDTDYIFIVSYDRNGKWIEMRRKTVRTMAGGQYYGGSYEPTSFRGGNDVTLECPVVQDVGIQSVSWFKGADRENGQLIARHDMSTGVTTYASDRDPQIEVIDGLVLKIKGRSPEYAGHYRCRYSLLGTGNTWQTAERPQLVTLYITWETKPGIVSYNIQYRPYGNTGRWQQISLRDSDQPKTVVQNLLPVTRYEFEVYDFSDGFQGDLLDTLVETTGQYSEEDPSTSEGCDEYLCGRGVCHAYPEPHCVCDYGFQGERCDIAVNYCDSNPCTHGGLCNALPHGYVCQCRNGYSGTNCERARTNCNPNPCENNGVCFSTENGFTCVCRRGYAGLKCQLQSRPCDSRPCVYGSCYALGRSYQCECDRGYEGRNCDQVDRDPSMLLKCPIQNEYGSPRLIQWVRVSDGERTQIYAYDVANNRTTEAGASQYRGRLSSPSVDSLIIRDSSNRDVGTYECVVSYPDRAVRPSSMRLVQVPLDDTRVTVSWRPNRMYIDHYDVKHRDVASDDDFITVQIPRGSNQYTFTDVEPGSVYEISITPYTGLDDVNNNIEFDVLESSVSTTPMLTTTTTTRAPSRADKQYDELTVTVYGPAEPVEIGSTTYLHCSYREIEETKPTVAWKKIVGDNGVFIYNQKMPPTASRNRISMTNEHQLRIKKFQLADAGIYECTVSYDTPYSRTSGSGQVQLESAEMVDLSPPTNLKHVIIEPTKTMLTWQAPRVRGVTGYIVRYYPTTRRFGEYEKREVSTARIALDDLIEGGEYKVEIRASNGRKYSEPLEGWFDQVVEKIPAPINFIVQMLSRTQAQINWEQPDPRGITGYRIKYWDISRPAEDNLVTKQTRLNSVVLTDLVDGKQYQVWIHAMKGETLSPQLVGQFRKTTPDSPNPPSTIKFKNIESDSVTAYWDAPEGWKRSDKYRVTVNSVDQDYPYSKTYPDSAPSTMLINYLRPGLRYRVTVYNVRNEIPSIPVYRHVKTVEVFDLTIPYPDLVTLTCKLRMTDAPYRVRWYKVDSKNKEQLIFTSTATSRGNESIPNPNAEQFLGRLSSPSITQVSIANIRYPEDFGKYKCVARSPSTTGSDLIEIVGKYPISIAPPYRLLYDFTNDSTARITWEHPYPNDITGYRVRYWPTNLRYGKEKQLETTERVADLTELVKGTEYQIEIKAKINKRISDDSLIAQLINFAKHVKNVKIERLPDGEELNISWENPIDIDGIQLSIRQRVDQQWNDQPPTSKDTTSRRIRLPMEPGEKVYFKITTLKNNIHTPVVAEYTEMGVLKIEEPSEAPEFLLPENTPGSARVEYPEPVSDLQLESLNPTSLSARWEPTPDVYYDHYSVVITNIRTKEYEKFNITKSYIEVRGLSAYQPYEVRVFTVRNGIFSFPVAGRVTLRSGEQPPEAIPVDAEETESEPLHRNTLVPQPTNLRFSNVMRSRFTVEWDSPSDEITDFEVKYRPRGEDDQAWFKVTANGYTSVTLRGLTSDTLYDVTVSSKLEKGEKSYPLAGEQRTQRPTQRRVILKQPRAEVTGKTSTSFNLSWTEQNAEHRVVVTPIGGVGRRQTINVPTGESTLVVTGLEPGKRHRTTITPLSGGRKSKPAVLYTTTNPNSPTELKVAALESDTVTLTWREPASTLTTGYDVTYYPVSTDDVNAIQTTRNSVEITGLYPETEYIFEVKTKQGNEKSAPTLITVTTTTEPVSAPAHSVTSVSGNDLVIRWTPVDDAESYEVTYFPADDESDKIKRRIDSPTTLLRIPDVFPGNYVVRVAAIKEDQLSLTHDSTISMPVEAPRNLRIDGITNDGVNASWDAPTNVIYAPSYDVIVQPNSVHKRSETAPEQTDSTHYKIEGLRPNTEYTIKVISRYHNQKSEPITGIVSTAPLQRPTNVQSTIQNGVIRVNWSPVDGAESYEVTYYPTSDASQVVTVELPKDVSYYDVPNNNSGQYEIKVVAVKDDQKSPFASVRQRLGVDSPISVSFSDITEDTVVVEWIPPRTRQRFTYEVRLTPVDDVTQAPIVKDTEYNWYLFTDLQPATRYVAEVVAVFGEQRSEPTSDIVTTGVPLTRRVTAPARDGNQPVEVTWREVPDADSYIVTYYPVGGSPQVVNVAGDRNGVILNDLIPDTEYVVTVTTVINEIEGLPNEISLTTGPVATPQNIETAPSDESLRVLWTPVENVDEYEVTYFPVGERHNTISKVVTSPYYDITDVEPGEYEVTVTAIKSGHRSPQSSILQNIGVKPPTDIQFTDATETEFVVVWTPSPTRDVTYYEVRVTNPDNLNSGPIFTETSDNFVRIQDLPSGTTYVVEVVAKNDLQRSEPLVGTVSTEVPAPDSIDTYLPEEDGAIQIEWGEVPNVDEFEVSYYPVGGQPEILVIPGDQTRTVLHDLLPGSDYVIEVTSYINEIPSTPTVIELTTPLKTPKEAVAQPLTGDSTPGQTSVRITWDDDRSVPEYEVTYYSVVRIGDEVIEGEPQILRVPSNDRGVVLNDLLPATEYIVEIKAVDGQKTSRPEKVTITTPLDRPERVEIEEPGEQEITIRWQHPLGEVTEYVVELIPTDGSDNITISISPRDTSVTATGLEPDTEYDIRIKAVNQDKDVESLPVSARIRTKPFEVRPNDVTFISETNGSYTFTWDRPDKPIQYYRITWIKTSGTPQEDSLEISGDENVVTIPQLQPDSDYTVVIQSVTNPSDEPDDFNSVTMRVKTEIPSLPDHITAPDITDNSVVVQWELPAQEAHLTGYRVEVFPEGSDAPITAVDVPRTTSRASLMGLKPDTTYTIKVTPHINRRPGKPATYTITTDELRTIPPPESVHIPETTSEDIVIQWYAPPNHEYITKYNILVVDEDDNTIVDEDVSPDTYTYTVSDLEPGTSYDVSVRSFVNDRKSEPAPEVATTLPKQPHDVTVIHPLPNQFEISWAPSEGEVIRYLVNVIPEDNDLAQELFFETKRPSILIADVEPNTTYTIQVITVGQRNLESSPTTIRLTTPSEPEDRRPATEIKPEGSIRLVPEQPEIVVNWQQLLDQPIVSYQVLYRIPGNDKTNIITVPSGTGQIVLSSLEPREQYDIWVRGLMETGEIIPIPIIDHQIVSVLAPEHYLPLPDEPVSAPGDGVIHIVWDNLGPDVTEYGITYINPETDEEHQVVVPGTYSRTVLSGLTPGDEYIISVIGMRNGQQPVVVDNINIGTTDDVPENPAVIGSTPTGQVTIQWTADIDDEIYDNVIGYKIIFDRKCCLGEPEMSWVPGKETDAATIAMLEPDTEYVFSVEATTSDGQNIPVDNVKIVNEIEFPDTTVTESLIPPTISGVDGEGYTVTVFWRSLREGTLPITHYIVSYQPLDNDYVPTFRVLVPKTETTHTVTGLASNTLYNIEVQSTNLPSKTVSSPATAQYLTPIDSDADATPFEEQTPPDVFSTRTPDTRRPIISIVTRPYPRPDATNTTALSEPLVNNRRSSTTKPTRPTPPVTRPTRPATRRTRPVTRPTRPATRRTRPDTRPTRPTTRPTRPATRPTRPATRPTRPVTRPTRPATRRTRPVTRPTRPTTIRTRPATRRTRPATRPTRPATRPTRPNTRSTPPTRIPNRPDTRPTLRPTTFDDSSFYTPDNGQMTITWEPFFEEDEDGSYRVILSRPDQPDDVKEVMLPVDSQYVTMTSLEPNTPFDVHIEANTEDGDVFLLSPSRVDEDQLPRTLHPYKWLIKPTITNIEPYGDEGTIVHWISPDNQHRQPTHFVLQFKPKYAPDSSRAVRVEIPANKTSHVVTGLEPGVDYIVTLQSANQPTKTRSSTEIIEYRTGAEFESEVTSTRYTPTITSRTRPTTRTRPNVTITYRPITTSATTTRRPDVVQPSLLPPRSTIPPKPVTEPNEPNEGGGLQDTTTQPTFVEPEEDKAGVDALPTFDDNIIINWTPVTTPVENYIVEWKPNDRRSPGKQVTLTGDTSWVSIPAPTDQSGYTITIYTLNTGERPEPIYDVQLSQSPNTNGFYMTYKPAKEDAQPSTVTRTVTTQEIFIPGDQPSVELPGTDYTLLSDTLDQEYLKWLQPARRVSGADSITLYWNPEPNSSTRTSRVNRYRLVLKPINNPRARTISTYVPANAPFNIRGIQPGVSYNLEASYIQDDGEHMRGDIAKTFVIPAFSRYGTPITERTFGINEVWMKELRSGELLLQWDNFPGATEYTIEYQESPNGRLHKSYHSTNDRWIVLPRLEPGHLYTLKIYATVNGVSNQIYTVTVRRKETRLSPPSKVTWYNMMGHSVDLSWIPPQQPITGYKITYHIGTSGESLRDYVVNLPANVTTYTLEGLIPGETYTITIQSVRGEELSRPLTFPLKILVPTVRRIYFQHTAPQVIMIRWPEMPDYVTGYRVQVKQIEPRGQDLIPETDLPSGQYNFAIDNVQPGVTYEFTIRTMVGDKLSEPIVLHLWTLRSESELSRVENTQSGTWTVSWTRGPFDVDHWKIEVKPFGSDEVVFVDDNISPYRTSYRLQNLNPGVEYVIYIYGVRGTIISSPIQIRIPANPNTHLRDRQITHRRENKYVSGPQLVKQFLIRRRLDQIEMELIPVTTVERYIIKYKKSHESLYSNRGVRISYGDHSAVATIKYLTSGTPYNISVTAINGMEQSEVNVNVDTPVRSIIRPNLSPLQNIERYNDNRQASGFFIRWDAPSVPVSHYTVTYTEHNQAVTKTVTKPSVHLPDISEGHAATYVISYTTRDGRTSPKSIMNVSYARTRSSRPNLLGYQSINEEFEEEEELP